MAKLEAIEEKCRQVFGSEIIDVTYFRDELTIKVKKDKIKDIAAALNQDKELCFDFLSNMVGVDCGVGVTPRFEVVYHLYSVSKNHRLRIKVCVEEKDCVVDSVVSVWKAADWQEREIYDLLGIKFQGHPDLRRILLPDDWEGHPLRKDYPLEGY